MATVVIMISLVLVFMGLDYTILNIYILGLVNDFLLFVYDLHSNNQQIFFQLTKYQYLLK